MILNRLRYKLCTLILIALLFFKVPLVYGQQTDKDSITPWQSEKKIGVLLNQASFSNWLAGGVNNFSGTFRFDWDLQYKGEQWEWDTALNMALGYAKTQGVEGYTKMDDQLLFRSLLQLRSDKAWNFSSNLDIKTQNAPGYAPSATPNTALDQVQTTGFFSPAYLSLGIGFSYVKEKSFQLAINPLNARLVLVDRLFTQALRSGDTYFGVAAGKTARWEAGLGLSLRSSIALATNIKLKNQLRLVSNYLEEFKNVDLDHNLALDMKVNDNISALLEIQWVYDDNALAKLQTRQVFGMAIALPF